MTSPKKIGLNADQVDGYHGDELAVLAEANTFEQDITVTGDLNHDGSNVGFFGTAPVAQQNVPLTSPTVQDVIDALVALGLVEQSDP